MKCNELVDDMLKVFNSWTTRFAFCCLLYQRKIICKYNMGFYILSLCTYLILFVCPFFCFVLSYVVSILSVVEYSWCRLIHSCICVYIFLHLHKSLHKISYIKSFNFLHKILLHKVSFLRLLCNTSYYSTTHARCLRLKMARAAETCSISNAHV
jgi:hypothetical protein